MPSAWITGFIPIRKIIQEYALGKLNPSRTSVFPATALSPGFSSLPEITNYSGDMDIFKIPWPWYVAGPLIGLTVPALLLLGNKPFGISSSLRHICAACLPANLPFFSYNWRDEIWNLLFVLGILIGGYIGGVLLENPDDIVVASHTREVLSGLKISDFSGLLPSDLFSTENILSTKGLVFLVAGGFLVGFGTRYAGGCTSGHAIMGLSNLQWPSLLATVCFMASGILTTFYIIPVLLKILL